MTQNPNLDIGIYKAYMFVTVVVYNSPNVQINLHRIFKPLQVIIEDLNKRMHIFALCSNLGFSRVGLPLWLSW